MSDLPSTKVEPLKCVISDGDQENLDPELFSYDDQLQDEDIMLNFNHEVAGVSINDSIN